VLHTKNLLHAFVWLAALAGLFACAPSASRTGPGDALRLTNTDAPGAPARALPDRIYAIHGEPLVIPVGSPLSIPKPLTRADGTELSTRLFLVSRGLKPLDPLAWLEPAGGWVATEHPLGQPIINEAGLWMVLVQFPEHSSSGPLLLGDRRLPIIWLPAPPRTTESRFLPRLNASASAWRELGNIITPLRNDPAQRWRIRLLSDRVRADRLFGAGGTDFNEKPIDNELLEALARQTELRYRAAIARIQLADPRAAADLLALLTAVVVMPDGQLLPAWADITPRVSTIIDTAINSARPPARAAEATRSFVAALSPIRSWIIDDAATTGGTYSATVGIRTRPSQHRLVLRTARSRPAPSSRRTARRQSARRSSSIRLSRSLTHPAPAR